MKRWLKTAICALSALLAAALILYGDASAKARAERGKADALYQRAFYEAEEHLAGLQLSLKKLAVTADKRMEIKYLSNIARQAQCVQDNLSVLPVSVKEIASTIKFVNQAGDFAGVVLANIASGGAITSEDRANMDSMLVSVTNLSLDMRSLMTDDWEGKRTLADSGFLNAGEGARSPMSNPSSDYPRLLYDGPFADSVHEGELLALGSGSVLPEEAEGEIIRLFGAQVSEIQYLSTTGGDVPVYEFSCLLNGNRAYAGVTQMGGRILYVLSEEMGGEEAYDEEQCMKIAQNFLIKDFGETRVSYYRKYNGAVTVNLAPYEKETILYPDLIKVEVSMSTGKVSGAEFSSYWKNHTERAFGEPALSAEAAKQRISAVLRPESARLALIPVNASEKLAYEVFAKDAADEYLIYIDALTGEEIDIFQVVHLTDGTYVQ